MAGDVLRELKVILNLEDKATGELKKRSAELKKGNDELSTGLKSILSLKNAVIVGVLGTLASVAVNAADKFIGLSNSLQQTAYRLSLSEQSARDLLFRIQDLGKVGPFATEAMVSAFNRLTEAGLTANAALGALEAAQASAAESGTGLADVSNFIGKLMEENLVETPEEAQALFDELAKAATAAGVPLESMISAFLQNAQGAKNAGISLQDLIKLMATDVAGLGLNAGLELLKTQLAALSGDPKAINYLQSLGEEFALQPGDNIDEAIKRLAVGLSTLSEADIEKMKTLRKILLVSGEKSLADIITQIINATPGDIIRTIRIAFGIGGEGEPGGKSGSKISEQIGKLFEGIDLAIGNFITNPKQTLFQDVLGSKTYTPQAPLLQPLFDELGKTTERQKTSTELLNEKIDENIGKMISQGNAIDQNTAKINEELNPTVDTQVASMQKAIEAFQKVAEEANKTADAFKAAQAKVNSSLYNQYSTGKK